MDVLCRACATIQGNAHTNQRDNGAAGLPMWVVPPAGLRANARVDEARVLALLSLSTLIKPIVPSTALHFRQLCTETFERKFWIYRGEIMQHPTAVCAVPRSVGKDWDIRMRVLIVEHAAAGGAVAVSLAVCLGGGWQ